VLLEKARLEALAVKYARYARPSAVELDGAPRPGDGFGASRGRVSLRRSLVSGRRRS
jgi:hypothetical protein